MSNPIVIIKNNTESPISINDLSGVTVDSTSQLELTDIFYFYDIVKSINLKTYVSNGNIIINDGNNDLSISNALNHIGIISDWQIYNKIYTQSGNKKIEFSIGSHADEHFESGSAIWQHVRSFIFPGTDIWTPTTIRLILSRSNTNNTSYVRIAKHADGLVIGETSWTQSDPIIYTINSLSNFPESEEILCIQIKKDQGSSVGNSRIHWFNMT